MEQRIKPSTGEFFLDDGFVVSSNTNVAEILGYFSEEKVKSRDFKNGHHQYTVRNLKLGELYFILTFYFLKDHITKIGIVVQAEPYDENAGWESFDEKQEMKKGQFMEQWMAAQQQRDYKKYDWGQMGVNYDFHNRCSSCFISYNSRSVT